MSTSLTVEFKINDLSASYEIIGTSDNYSFHEKLGAGLDLVSNIGDDFVKTIPLKGNYGIFNIKVFAISSVGVKSLSLNGNVEVLPKEIDSTFTFSEINILSEEDLDSSVVYSPQYPGDKLEVNQKFAGRSFNLNWSIIPPSGHPLAERSLGQELINDYFLSGFKINLKNESGNIDLGSIGFSETSLNSLSSSPESNFDNVADLLGNYKDFNISFDENVFNDLNLPRNFSIEIISVDKFQREATGIINLDNPEPILNDLNYSLKGSEVNFFWDSSDVDFKGVNIEVLGVPEDLELVYSSNISSNAQDLKKIEQAKEYKEYKNAEFLGGEYALYQGKVYQSTGFHVRQTGETPENSDNWELRGDKVKYFHYIIEENENQEEAKLTRDYYNQSFIVEKNRNPGFTIGQLWGYKYYYSFQPFDAYGLGKTYNLTRFGTIDQDEPDSELYPISINLDIENFIYRELDGEFVFNWDVVDRQGNVVDLNQHKFLFDEVGMPSVLGLSGSLFDVDSKRYLTGITEGYNSRSLDFDEDGEVVVSANLPTAKVFDQYKYTRQINNQLYGTGGFPVSLDDYNINENYDSGKNVIHDGKIYQSKQSNYNYSQNIHPSYPEWNTSLNVNLSGVFVYENNLYRAIDSFGPESDNISGVFDYRLQYNTGDIVLSAERDINQFDEDIEYYVDDIVYYTGSIYKCKKNIRQEEIITPLDIDYWGQLNIFKDLPNAYYRSLLTGNSNNPFDNPYWEKITPKSLRESGEYFDLIIPSYEHKISDWNSSSNYIEGSLVVYENDIWSGTQSNHNQAPSGTSQYWTNTSNSQDIGLYSSYHSRNYLSGDLVYSNNFVYKCIQDDPTAGPIIAKDNAGQNIFSDYESTSWVPFWELHDYNNVIFGHIGIPESGKRNIGMELAIVDKYGNAINKKTLEAYNPPPEILKEGFEVNSTSKASRVRFNFNYKQAFAEKTTKVNLYRSSEKNFDIIGTNRLPYNSTQEALQDGSNLFVKTVIGEGESADFGDNITELFDDPPLLVDYDGIEHPTGYYYKILPFDDFGSGVLHKVSDNSGELSRVIVYPKNYHDPNPFAPIGPITKSSISGESIPGPVENFSGSTSFENYFLNWNIPNSQKNSNNNLIKVIPNDIDYYEVWMSEFDHLEVNGQDLIPEQNASGFRRILGNLPSTGSIPQEMTDIGYSITNATEILEVPGNSLSLEAVHKGETNERKYFWVRAVDKGGNKSPFTGSATTQNNKIEGLGLILPQSKTTDVENFEQNLTEIFPNTLALVPNNPFKASASQAGNISWDRHLVYYNGTGYVIAPGETGDAFIYWSATGRRPTHNQDIVKLTSGQSGELGLIGPGGGILDNSIYNPLRNVVYSGSYDSSSYHPAGEGYGINPDQNLRNLLGDEHDFIIARNHDGAPVSMWHSFANGSIGSAHIQDGSIINAKIHNLTADKIRSAEIFGQDIQIAGDDTSGQIRSAGFSGLNSIDLNGDQSEGFAISGNGKFVFQTKKGKIYFEDDELTVEGNIKQKDGSNFTLLNVSASPNYFDYIETANNDIIPENEFADSKILAYYKNININPNEVRFKAIGSNGATIFDYNDHNNGLYDISGFKYNPSLVDSDVQYDISGGFNSGSNRATAVFDVTGFDYVIKNLNQDTNGSVVVFASGIDVGIEAATSIGILSDGAPGPTGRSPVYRGTWNDSKSYTGLLDGTNGFDDLRGDVVFLSGDYYIAKNNSGPDLIGIGSKNPALPEGENFWKVFGSQFESVATQLLLTEDAIITHNLIMGEEDANNPGAGIGGIIKTFGKEYGNGTTGFFLGNTGSLLYGPNPQFDIGSDKSYMRFDASSNKVELKGTFINNSVQDPNVVFSSSSAADNLATFVGGGYNNSVSSSTGLASSILGGGNNSITGRFSSIVGGFHNVVNDNFSVIVGGFENTMPLLDSGNEGGNFIGAGVQNTISGGTAQSIVNGFDNIIADKNPYFLYDPDNSIFSEKFLGKGLGETILTSGGYANNTRFPTDGSIDYWQNGFFFSYLENDKVYSTAGLDSENWFYSLDFGWFWISDLKEDIYNFDQADNFPHWIYISGDSSASPQKSGLGWTFFQESHTQTGIENTPNGVTSGEGIVFYQPSKILNPTGSVPGWVYMCKDNGGIIYYSGVGTNTNWQPLNN